MSTSPVPGSQRSSQAHLNLITGVENKDLYYRPTSEQQDDFNATFDRLIRKWCEEGKLENTSHGKYHKLT